MTTIAMIPQKVDRTFANELKLTTKLSKIFLTGLLYGTKNLKSFSNGLLD
jgi:hypothetical protein